MSDWITPVVGAAVGAVFALWAFGAMIATYEFFGGNGVE